ncbi:MAG: arylsulfatase A [Planctomycetota bacterium]|nr:MAG: arylsulfatase A [Planctomycetota bacterium]
MHRLPSIVLPAPWPPGPQIFTPAYGALLLGWLLVLCAFGSPRAVAAERPNIILIMADDVSWECFGCYGAQEYATPHIDRMAERGVRFAHCYSTPICTTSRVQIMTGKYNFRNYTHFGYLNPAERTFAQKLKQAGYHTAIAGKWQLNGLANNLPGWDDNQRPIQAGFDEYMLWQLTRGKGVKEGGGERYWSPVLEHNGKLLGIEDNLNKYGPDMLCDFVCDFVQRHEQGPFFVYYPMVLVHNPFVPTPDTIGSRPRDHSANKASAADQKKNFVDMVHYMDKIVGRICDKVQELGIAEDTIILFTADNGTNRSIVSRWQGQMIRGGKGGMTDMGTHVPLVAWWEGHTPAGQTLDALVDFTDFYPTLAAAADLELDANDPVDGTSFLPLLQGQPMSPRKWVFCHYQPYWGQVPGQFIRNQRYKLYRDGRYFDIGSGDLREERDLRWGLAGLDGERTRKIFTRILAAAPPAPVGVGSRNTQVRPIYPDWPVLVEPND